MTGALTAHGRAPLNDGELELALDLLPGSVVALVGPNGAGKSSTLSVLLGFTTLSVGRIALGDRVLDDAATSVPVHLRGFGWAPQGAALLPRLRVAHQVARFLSPQAPLATMGADGLLDALSIGHLADRRSAALSGGEAQRVSVARALGAGRFALLDEPTSAQDDEGARAVRDLIRTHAEAGGAVLLVTHRIADAHALADEVVVLQECRVVAAGTPESLAMSPITSYIAHEVGATVLRGTLGADGVVRGSWGQLTVGDDAPPGPVTVTVRPGAVVVHRGQPSGSSRNVLPSVVAEVAESPIGVAVRLDGTPAVVATLTHAAAAELDLRVGDRVWASVKANDLEVTAGPHA